MNVILQPIHLLLYMSLIGAATDLVARNPIYALVAIGFLIPAEKFIKNMFGLNKASSTSDFGSFAKNALAYEGLKKMGSAISGGSQKSAKAIKGVSADAQDSEGATFNKIRRAELGAYAANTGDLSDTNNSRSDEKADNPRLANSKELTEEQKKQMELDNIRQEKERLGQELDEYENNGGDIYSSTDPEIKAKQLRYQELDDQEKGFNELQERQEQQDNIRLDQGQQAGKARININSGSTAQAPKGYKRRIAGRLGKAAGKTMLKGAKGGAKAALRLGLAAGGATIGLASAISTGDVSNVAKLTIGGAAAGNQIGKGVVNLAGNTAKSGIQAVRDGHDTIADIINDEKHGTAVSKEMRNERLNARERKKFLKDESQIKKYTEMKRDIGYNGDVKNLMNAAADYKELGVSDDMIKNALKVEQKRDGTIGGTNHEKMLDVASFATENGYKKSDILSNKNRSDMEDVVQSTIAEKDRYEVMKNIADLYDAGDFYSKNSRFKQPSSKPKASSNVKVGSNVKAPINDTKIRTSPNNNTGNKK